MPNKKVKGPTSKRQARYLGVLASRGVGWAKDKLRGRKLKGLPASKGSPKKRKGR
jgi:hypothetical protein